MTVLDAREILEPANADEVLAFYLTYAEPGDVVSFHTDWCRTQLHVCEDCTCTPKTMKIGAKG
jgi:hypothetical protein